MAATIWGATQIDSGGGVTCALMSDSTVTCFGASNTWVVMREMHNRPLVATWLTRVLVRAGNQWEGQFNVPKGLSGVAQVSVGWNSACALMQDSAAVCWGK